MTQHQDVAATNPLLREIRAAHAMFLRDLESCQTLVDSTDSARSEDQLPRLAALRGLSLHIRATQDLLSFCQLLREHHALEDRIALPPVRAAAPHLAGLIQCLQADHRELQSLIGRIEQTVLAIDTVNVSMTFAHLSVALEDLKTRLARHFDREEEVLGPVIETWQSWPQQL